MNRIPVAACFVIALTIAAQAQDLDPENSKAQPKEGRPFTATMSERNFEIVSNLPSLGRIEWRVTKLPWVTDGPYEGISGTGMVSIDDDIYVVGGFIPGRDGTSDSRATLSSHWTWRFDTETEEWHRLPDMPVRREYVRAIATDDSIYFMGGGRYNDDEPPYQAHDDVGVLNVKASDPQWKVVDSLNVPRTHMSVGRVGDYLIAAGGNEYDWAEKGYSHNTIRKTVEVFDLNNPDEGWQVKTPIPGVGRGWAASMPKDGYLYMLGGVTWNEEGATVATRETLRFDPAKNTWEALTPPPVGISGWEGALYADRYAIAVGGVYRPSDGTKGAWSDLAFAYDIEKDTWLSVDGPLPPGAVFNDPGVVILGDTIYVLGAEGPGGSHYNYFLIGTINPG